MVDGTATRCELIIGGQKSGKSQRAESIAAIWLAAHPSHRAVLIATALAGDREMQARIARHQQSRAAQVPTMQTVEAPLLLAEAIAAHHDVHTLVVVDCMTLWLTNWLMPAENDTNAASAEISPDLERKDRLAQYKRASAAIISIADVASKSSLAPLILVSNEIGLGVIPLGHGTRQFVDELGNLNQALARAANRVVLMAAGLPLLLKDEL
jgi:adenosylcobinamide kinase / adenosylcobinamide-phosphate guanylyltransferase